MKNPRLTPKDRALIKGALRRAFSRSELRKRILDATKIEYSDPDRPRVKKWSICASCHKKTPTYQVQVDHIDPLIPLDQDFENMSLDVVLDRLWCDENNLQILCLSCHTDKCKVEREQRKILNPKPKKVRGKKK